MGTEEKKGKWTVTCLGGKRGPQGKVGLGGRRKRMGEGPGRGRDSTRRVNRGTQARVCYFCGWDGTSQVHEGFVDRTVRAGWVEILHASAPGRAIDLPPAAGSQLIAWLTACLQNLN